ncbi:MAG: S9 family peptidase [Wenzhouxiangellaceae bacterium]|nr:S9 family peptidase [Wenzhouxiangellaceae bacterium]
MIRILVPASIALTVSLLLASCGGHDSDPPVPPQAERRDHVVSAPAGDRFDPYHWLRDDRRSDPEVIALLEAENAYTQGVMAGERALIERLEGEMRRRIPAEQTGAPWFDDGYWYYTRHVAGGEYPVYARRRGSMNAEEEILLDGNALGGDRNYFRIGGWDVSPDGRRLLWLQDVLGRRQFQLMIRDLETGEVVDTGRVGLSSASWAADGRSVLYVENHPETLRSFRVRRLLLDAEGEDPVLHEEADTAFFTSVGRTRSDRYNYVFLRSTTSTEMRILDGADLHDPDARLEVFLPRRPGHEYAADHVGDHWIVRTNRDAPNFRIMRVDDGGHADFSAWTDLVPHREDVFVHEFDPFETFLAVAERVDGLRRLRILDYLTGRSEVIAFDEEAYVAQLGRNPEPGLRRLQFAYTSLTTPRTTFELDLDTGQRRRVDRLRVGGGFDPDDYGTRRLWIEARDGTRIPVSLGWHVDTPLDGTAPLYQFAYGSYGRSSEPAFSSERLSLLDRGFVFAIAHVRGGQEMGREWYEQGRLLQKRNSFTDFIDVTRGLVGRGLVDGERVFATGGSAGGLLVGAVANMAPDDYAGIVAHVPFVDVVTTMLDESIPLTTNEFDEWGDPRQPEYYRYMLSYSPYDNVVEQDYPAMLVTTGLWDSQVQYWEPVKWVARLRHRKTGNAPVLLRVDMQAGHGGQSGRYRKLGLTAMEYAFVLRRAGLEG